MLSNAVKRAARSVHTGASRAAVRLPSLRTLDRRALLLSARVPLPLTTPRAMASLVVARSPGRRAFGGVVPPRRRSRLSRARRAPPRPTEGRPRSPPPRRVGVARRRSPARRDGRRAPRARARATFLPGVAPARARPARPRAPRAWRDRRRRLLLDRRLSERRRVPRSPPQHPGGPPTRRAKASLERARRAPWRRPRRLPLQHRRARGPRPRLHERRQFAERYTVEGARDILASDPRRPPSIPIRTPPRGVRVERRMTPARVTRERGFARADDGRTNVRRRTSSEKTSSQRADASPRRRPGGGVTLGSQPGAEKPEGPSVEIGAAGAGKWRTPRALARA